MGAPLTDYVTTLLELIHAQTPNLPIGLVGHSVGSVIAAEAAHQLGTQCTGVLSIEGNLTADDAYFSSRAADFENAQKFKDMFIGEIRRRGVDSNIFRQYY